MQVTAMVRIARANADARIHNKEFSALPCGLAALADWLRAHGVTAAALEGTGVCRETVFDTIAEAGITPLLLHAQHVKQIKGRKTDIADGVWLARVCQFGLCNPSLVPPKAFRALRRVARARRMIVAERTRTPPAHHP